MTLTVRSLNAYSNKARWKSWERDGKRGWVGEGGRGGEGYLGEGKGCGVGNGLYLDSRINPLNAELNAICHLLALLGAHHILHLCRIRVKCVRF